MISNEKKHCDETSFGSRHCTSGHHPTSPITSCSSLELYCMEQAYADEEMLKNVITDPISLSVGSLGFHIMPYK